MKITKITCAFIAAGTIGFLGAPIALAEGPTPAPLGTPGKLVDGAGTVVQHWTITGLKTSTDKIPYPVAGTLWEATATDEAIQGGVTPIVSNLNARARNGETYQALFGVATPQGVNPSTLAQGQKTTGKVYFDVTGATPDSVVYNAGGVDLLVWVQSAAPARQGGGGQSGATRGTAAPAEADDAAAIPAAEPTEGTPLAEGSQGTPVPAANQGEGSQGTPVPAANQGSQGTPVPAANQGSQGTPVPAVNEGTPVVVNPPAKTTP